ncbi:MAG: Transcriptional repressor of the fructose operon, DeoR family, partial [uncultured Corynebacteriales bacterium]
VRGGAPAAHRRPRPHRRPDRRRPGRRGVLGDPGDDPPGPAGTRAARPGPAGARRRVRHRAGRLGDAAVHPVDPDGGGEAADREGGRRPDRRRGERLRRRGDDPPVRRRGAADRQPAHHRHRGPAHRPRAGRQPGRDGHPARRPDPRPHAGDRRLLDLPDARRPGHRPGLPQRERGHPPARHDDARPGGGGGQAPRRPLRPAADLRRRPHEVRRGQLLPVRRGAGLLGDRHRHRPVRRRGPPVRAARPAGPAGL